MTNRSFCQYECNRGKSPRENLDSRTFDSKFVLRVKSLFFGENHFVATKILLILKWLNILEKGLVTNVLNVNVHETHFMKISAL